MGVGAGSIAGVEAVPGASVCDCEVRDLVCTVDGVADVTALPARGLARANRAEAH